MAEDEFDKKSSTTIVRGERPHKKAEELINILERSKKFIQSLQELANHNLAGLAKISPQIREHGHESLGKVYKESLESAQFFRQPFARAEQAGLNLKQLRGITSDGVARAGSYMKISRFNQILWDAPTSGRWTKSA